MNIQALAISLFTLFAGLVIYLIAIIVRILLNLMKEMLNLKITTPLTKKKEAQNS